MPSLTADIPQTAANLRWIFPDAADPLAADLARALDLPPWFASILVGRGFADELSARAFLQPDLTALHDPSAMTGMHAAVERILRAITSREPILIYGDYDVDGTLATVLLKTAIDRLTPKFMPSLVRYHIPHRIREGYGVQPAVLGNAAAEGIRLVVSVDTGIRAFAAAAEAKALGLDLIVTDHHLPDGLGVPEAVAVVNPNQDTCAYPFKDLCGAAVAFKVASALLLEAAKLLPGDRLQPIDTPTVRDKLLPSLLKLVAIATVADAVPLQGENRVMVALGLRSLADVRQPGLRSLLDFAEVRNGTEPPTATAIAFRVAPRINAAGRMDIAEDVVRMLLTRDADEGRALAQKLHDLNTDRRTVEAAVLLEIEARLAMLDADAMQDAGCLVLDGHGWHRGVVGILASRVVERTGRPALVVTHEDGKAHGSGRSVAGFHLLDAVTAAHHAHAGETSAQLFDRFGGHAHAIGFSLPSAHVDSLRRHLSRYAAGRLTPTLLQPTLTLDAELPFSAINDDALRLLATLEPFGHGASEPVFVACGVTVVDVRILKDRHIKLMVQQGSSPFLQCLGWSRSVAWPQRVEALNITRDSRIDLAFHLRENRHADFGGPELQLCDLRLHIPESL